MTPTNQLGLPEPLVTYLERDDYSAGDSWRTATELIGPARAAALRHAYPEQQDVEDVADMVSLLLGKAIHSVLERAGRHPLAMALQVMASSGAPIPRELVAWIEEEIAGAPQDDTQGNALREERLYATIGGQRISGQLDHYTLRDGLLSDYKSTSIYTVQHALRWQGQKRTRFEEWEQQLNVYAYLCELHGYSVSGIETVVFLDGWSRAAARRSEKYPQTKVVRFPFRLWDLDEQQDFLAQRVAAHQLAERQVRDGLPLMRCTMDERWQEPSEWAVMRANQTRAVAKYESYAMAADAIPVGAPTLSVVERVQPSKRCLPGRDGYCPMRTYCASLNDGQFRDGELAVPASWEDA